MKNLRTSAVLIPTLLVALTACGSSTTTSGSAPTDSAVRSGIEAPSLDASTDGSAPLTDAVTTSVTPAATTTPTTDAAPTVTAPPATNPPHTTTPHTTPHATTPTTTTPTTTTPVDNRPKINDFSADAKLICFPEVHDYPYPSTLTATWNVSGATSIYIAIDNENGPYEMNLAATGSIELPAAYPCPNSEGDVGTQTYYLVAENESGRTVVQQNR